MRRLLSVILLNTLLLPLAVEAKELPCDSASNPIVCAFLNRYITNILNWDETNVSTIRKMRDDKFIILDGSLDNISLISDSSIVSINRYDDKAYEAIWQDETGVVLLRVAFPIQYELLLGMPQNEIEKLTHYYIERAPARERIVEDIPLDSIEQNIYRTSPRQHYELPALNNCRYLCKDSLGQIHYVCDSLQLAYTLANLFQTGLEKDYRLDVKQSIYGFNKLEYTITLQQWLNYCAEQNITSYVAIEEEFPDAVQVLVVAECKDLGFNHLLSILVPRDFLHNDAHFLVKMNAFIPTHNISNLYEQYKQQPKKERIWEEN